ncbi:hypothetical protein JN086_14180 [Mycolicibacterium austroafricanum]|uniref:Uncharacterized protein n=1 Tax=Mycolicibacterium austroafricanum TaxID=39687 RepID=A0ABT8HHS3_MYCAO|nr:hypothetical protein [Mycolicibacterium austroafricanum]MDN4520321.1 hypothetical protein [Mycolicibacterium austroafricanum]QRZ09251.1 hypothetical protein JN090_12550 [Mycolicibacterium austroafricanum]QZT71024.1 hypothetical protein JN086_14180 [Mycolicibacterium austroafricanum]
MSDTRTPPVHWVDDQARAWRLVAAIREHDGSLFDAVSEETRSAGYEAVDRLFAALARNLFVRVRMEIGLEALDELIEAELRACDSEPLREFPNLGGE